MSADHHVVVEAEVLNQLGIPDAQRLDHRIRLLATTINDNISKLYTLVQEAKAGQIHEALGFPSWTAYVADVFQVQVRLDREQRRELVGYLSGEGMPQRAIADVVGTSVGTVNNDLGQVFNSEHLPALDDPAEMPVEKPEPTPVIGIDGKRYPPRPERPQQKPRRRPITDQAFHLGCDLRRIINRLEKLVADDRFDRNREDIGNSFLPYVAQGMNVLRRMTAEINLGDQPAPVVPDRIIGRSNQKQQIGVLERLSLSLKTSVDVLEYIFQNGYQKTCTPEVRTQRAQEIRESIARLNAMLEAIDP